MYHTYVYIPYTVIHTSLCTTVVHSTEQFLTSKSISQLSLGGGEHEPKKHLAELVKDIGYRLQVTGYSLHCQSEQL